MAALLDVKYLRQQASHGDALVMLSRAIRQLPVSSVRSYATRLRLVATWRLNDDGRTVCQWTLDTMPADDPPPD